MVSRISHLKNEMKYLLKDIAALDKKRAELDKEQDRLRLEIESAEVEKFWDKNPQYYKLNNGDQFIISEKLEPGSNVSHYPIGTLVEINRLSADQLKGDYVIIRKVTDNRYEQGFGLLMDLDKVCAMRQAYVDTSKNHANN